MNGCFQQQRLNVNLLSVWRILRVFFLLLRDHVPETEDYILILNIQHAISQQLFWWGLLNYYFVWMHSKVNWSLLITVYISLSSGLQKNTLKWRLESSDPGTQRCLPDNFNSSLNWLTSQQQKRNKVFICLFWDELQEPAEKEGTRTYLQLCSLCLKLGTAFSPVMTMLFSLK